MSGTAGRGRLLDQPTRQNLMTTLKESLGAIKMTENRLTLKDLAGTKLIQPENLAPLLQVQLALDHTYGQASQGWGVTPEIAVYGYLATELRTQMEIAETADENRRMLKGAQMETGRLKKKIEKLDAEILARDLRIKELEVGLDEAHDQISGSGYDVSADNAGVSNDDTGSTGSRTEPADTPAVESDES